MGQVVFNEDTLRYVNLFQNVTRCIVVDCVEAEDKIIIVVSKGEASKAIGRKGETVARVRQLLKKDVQVVEFSEKPEEFDPRSYLKPAREAMKKVVALRMTQFGQAGHAGDYTPLSLQEMASRYK